MVDKLEHQKRSIERVLGAISTIQAGGMVIMTDDEDRENEGDLVFAASDVDANKVNFMAKEARGLICLTLEPEIVDRLKLPMMEVRSAKTKSMGTAFTVSIEAKDGVTTGISAADRAHTIRVAIADNAGPDDLVVPGHVFPLRAKAGGVLERAGHTEGSVDLARLAGKRPAAVICEIMKDDGSMARLPDLEKFSQKFEIPMVSIEDLITFRLLKDSLVEEVHRAPFETSQGTFEGIWFTCHVDGRTHFALVKGDDFANHTVDVRVHKQRPLIDVFSHPKSGGRSRIELGLDMLSKSDRAVFVYLTPEDENTALLRERIEVEEVKQPRAHGEAGGFDPRLFGIGAQILRQLGVRRMRVHLSSARSIKGLAGFGLEISDIKILDRN
jgi:3,4-dihydroxy 2-butanone 4-phosphate synthase/GTP cyclohydrolase II